MFLPAKYMCSLKLGVTVSGSRVFHITLCNTFLISFLIFALGLLGKWNMSVEKVNHQASFITVYGNQITPRPSDQM